MKVALVNPGRRHEYAMTPPVNLGILASYLEKNDVEVKIIDELSGDNVGKELVDFNPDLVGLTGTTPLIEQTYRDADTSRELGFKTVIGGIHASILPEEAIKHADTVLVGEGEESLYSLTQRFEKGIKKGGWVKSLDDIPIPSWHLINMNFYLKVRQRTPMSFLSFAPKEHLTGVLLTSRGCPYDCIFCHNSFKDKPFRFNSPERVVKEIELLQQSYNVESIFFIEDNFFCIKERVKKICKLIKSRGIELVWGANSRVDNIDEETLRMAKEAGCRQVTFGWESGSQKILDILNKKTTVEQNYKSVELCNKVGILANGTVMLGNPYETEEDLILTQKFMKEAKIDGGIGVCITTPYPGTALWSWCKDNNKIPAKFWWSDFDYHKVPIKIIDLPLGRFLEIIEETIEIAIDKYFGRSK